MTTHKPNPGTGVLRATPVPHGDPGASPGAPRRPAKASKNKASCWGYFGSKIDPTNSQNAGLKLPKARPDFYFAATAEKGATFA